MLCFTTTHIARDQRVIGPEIKIILSPNARCISIESPVMSRIVYTDIRQDRPPSVKQIICRVDDSWIGQINDATVLKYPHDGDAPKLVRIEEKMLNVLTRNC